MPELLTTTDARELRLSVKSIQRYYRDGKITPAYTTPGGHHRWKLEDVQEQMRALRRREG